MNDETGISLTTIFSSSMPDNDDAVVGEIVTTSEKTLVPVEAPQSDAEEEAAYTTDYRASIKSLRAMGEASANLATWAINIATQTDSDKSIEAASTAIQAAIAVHRELHNIHKTRRKGKEPAKGPGGINIEKAVVFQGTAQDLVRMIRNGKKDEA